MHTPLIGETIVAIEPLEEAELSAHGFSIQGLKIILSNGLEIIAEERESGECGRFFCYPKDDDEPAFELTINN